MEWLLELEKRDVYRVPFFCCYTTSVHVVAVCFFFGVSFTAIGMGLQLNVNNPLLPVDDASMDDPRYASSWGSTSTVGDNDAGADSYTYWASTEGDSGPARDSGGGFEGDGVGHGLEECQITIISAGTLRHISRSQPPAPW